MNSAKYDLCFAALGFVLGIIRFKYNCIDKCPPGHEREEETNSCTNISFKRKTMQNDNNKLNMNGTKQNWTMVFRGTAGIGIDVVDSFIGTSTLPIPDPGCYSRETLECNTHVRSTSIDDWKDLNIREVKIEMLTGGQTVAYIIFQNRATDDKITWFRPENILSSSWTDLPSETSGYPQFQLERSTYNGGNMARSLNVFHKLFAGCNNDEGWMFVSEVTGSKLCSHDYHLYYPVFLYTTGSTVQVFEAGYGIADVMIISIR